MRRKKGGACRYDWQAEIANARLEIGEDGVWLVGEWAVLVSSSSSLVRGTPCARTVRSQSTRSAQSRICLAHVHTHTAVYFCCWCFYRINISHKRNTARFLNGILILNSADKPSKQRLHPCSSNFGGFFFPFSFFPRTSTKGSLCDRSPDSRDILD